MTTKTRIYSIKLPFTIKEWRKGSRYILTKLTTNEVKIVYHNTKASGSFLETSTHKVLDVKNKMPYIIGKLIPDDACVVDEFSTSIDSIVVSLDGPGGNNTKAQAYNIKTCAKNKDGILEKVKAEKGGIIKEKDMKGLENQLENININEKADDEKSNSDGAKINVLGKDGEKLKINDEIAENLGKDILKIMAKCQNSGDDEHVNHAITIYKNRYFDTKTFSLQVKTHASTKVQKNVFELDKDFKELEIDFRTYNKKDLTKVGDRDYTNWESEYPCINLYKLVDVSVNSFGMGWVASEVDKFIRNLLVDVQQKIIKSYDEWKDLTEEDLKTLEDEMIQKFILKVE